MQGEGEQDPSTPGSESTTGQVDEESSSGGEDDLDGENVCLAAPRMNAGTYRGSLGGKESNGGGACGEGGPDVFFRLEVGIRSDVFVSAVGQDFEPRVGVFGNDCAARFDEFGLLCTQGVPGWILDVAAGTQLYIAVGADADVIEASRTNSSFDLEVRTRPVLPAGELCGDAARGRCESGTVCTADVEELTQRCTVVPGDRCSTATVVNVHPESVALAIDDVELLGDAHVHSCGGARSAERVFRLQLPPSFENGRLELEGEGLVGLAVRGPTCLPDEERACDPSPEQPSIVLSPPPAADLYVFAELPVDRSSEDAPAVLRVTFEDE